MASKPKAGAQRPASVVVSQMETAALMHQNQLWSALMLDGASEIRRLSGMPPREASQALSKSPPSVSKRGAKR